MRLNVWSFFSLQLQYGNRWGPLHPNVTYTADRQSEFLFGPGEYISNLSIYSAIGIAGFNIETNINTYAWIGLPTTSPSSIQGQRMLFISGSLHEFRGGPAVSKVKIYFDAC